MKELTNFLGGGGGLNPSQTLPLLIAKWQNETTSTSSPRSKNLAKVNSTATFSLETQKYSK